MTNAGGFVTHAATFESYGSLLEDSGTGSSLGFTGEMHDSTGLVYLRARYADPVTGTFLTRDPVIGQVGGMSIRWNPYIYAGANPVNYIDPDGRFFWFGLAIAAALAIGTIGSAVHEANMQANDKGWECVDWTKVASAAAAGFLGTVMGLADLVPVIGIFHLAVLLTGGDPAAEDSRVFHLLGLGAQYDSLASNKYFQFGKGVGSVVTLAVGAAQLYGLAKSGKLVQLKNIWQGGKNAVKNPGRWAGQQLNRLRQGAKSIWNGVKSLVKTCNSFSADTLVLTQDGLKPILEIEPGDEVIGYVEATGETGSFPVTDTIHHTDPEIVLLTIDDEVLETTAEHPFYTDDGVWVNAAELEVGEQVYSFSGDFGTVESVEVVTISQEMYNLTVAEAHTFFVGEGNWLVHNQQLSFWPLPPGFRPGELNVGRFYDVGRLNTNNGFNEVTPHHMPSDSYMHEVAPNYNYTYSTSDGTAMNMFDDGTKLSRHPQTRTWRTIPRIRYPNSPRTELAADIWDVRKIYYADAKRITDPIERRAFLSNVRERLNDVRLRNKLQYPDMFNKPKGC